VFITAIIFPVQGVKKVDIVDSHFDDYSQILEKNSFEKHHTLFQKYLIKIHFA
jgi:hypothetical protein